MSGATEQAIWTIAVAAASGLPCALLGCFLLLRRMSLLADAVGHGVLPGIALAVLFTGSLSSLPMLVGAMVFGLLTALLAETLNRQADVSEDASLGVVFTSLFAAGILLLSRYLQNTHIDVHCVSLPLLDLAAASGVPWFGVLVPEALPMLLLVLVAVVVFLALFWKELTLTTFDPMLATTLGLPVRTVHYLLVALVAGSTVAAFESFGSILVLGMFVVPPATARLATDRLSSMLFVSAVLTVTASIFGYALAVELGCSAAGMVVVAAGAQFALAFVLTPRHGVLARALRRIRLMRRIASEEILSALFRAEEGEPRRLEHHLAPWVLALARFDLRRKHLIDRRDSRDALTEAGRQTARSVIRAHRLWEAYLEKNFELPLDHLHAPAAEMEHYLGPELQTRLANELAAPSQDPHGRAIPPKDDRLTP